MKIRDWWFGDAEGHNELLSGGRRRGKFRGKTIGGFAVEKGDQPQGRRSQGNIICDFVHSPVVGMDRAWGHHLAANGTDIEDCITGECRMLDGLTPICRPFGPTKIMMLALSGLDGKRVWKNPVVGLADRRKHFQIVTVEHQDAAGRATGNASVPAQEG